LLLKRRAFILLLAACWVPAVVRAVQIYAARQFPQAAAFITVDAALWQKFISQQVAFLPVLLVALYTGAGAIAEDVTSGAFVIYLSKPFSRVDYVIGKAIPIMSAILAVTLVPALSLLAIHLSVADDYALIETSPLLPLSVVAYSVWVSLFFTLAVLSVSTLSRSGRVAGACFMALALGSKIVAGALSRLRLDVPMTFLSIIDAAVDSAHLFFGDQASGETPYLSFVAMTAFMLVCVAVVYRRLGAVEVTG